MKKNPLSRLNLIVCLVSGLFVGAPAGFLVGCLGDHRISPFLAFAIEVAVIAVSVALAIPANRALNRRRFASVEALRQPGLVPEADKTGDADVFRLAAEGKRREAALVFWELHPKFMIEFAESAVGIEKFRFTDGLVLFGILISVGSLLFVLFKQGRVTIGSLAFCLAAAVFCAVMRWWQHRRILQNRASIDAGQYSASVKRGLELWENPKSRWCFFRR